MLPDGRLLADHLDAALRNGGLGDVETGLFSGQEQDIKETLFRNVVKDRAIIFLIGQFPCSSQEFFSIREEATRLVDSFNKWKDEKTRSRLPWNRGEKKIVDAITFRTLAESANDEYENYAKQLGSSLPDDGLHSFYQDRTDYWSRIQEITEAALDIG